MSTYTPDPGVIKSVASTLIALYHQDVTDAEVRIDYLFAHGARDEKTDEIVGPAISKDGYEAAGMCRIVNLKDRVKGMGDAEILIDGDLWPKLTADQQQALVDHELAHIEVRRDKAGNILTDDIMRPLLRIRKHDRQMGWFDDIARRHGAASFEVKQFVAIVDEEGQTYMPFVDERVRDAVAILKSAAAKISASQDVAPHIQQSDLDEFNRTHAGCTATVIHG